MHRKTWYVQFPMTANGSPYAPHTDAVEAQDAIREQAQGADMVLMLSTLLHSVAVGNCLPSTTRVVCVDIDPATVTQLVDRGSAQAAGMVTDIGTFVPTLADELLAD